MEEQNQMQAVKRPWQGTTWAWLTIIISIIMSALLIFLLLGFAGAGIIAADQNVTTVMTGLMGVLAIVFIPILILAVFLIIGFFKGWKWAVIVAIIVEGLAVISALFGLGESGGFFNLLLSGFMLYLAIACVQHPFYNLKK